MKATAISLLCLMIMIFSSFQSSATILLQAPTSIALQEPFIVAIDAGTQERNDVKIYLRNASDAIFSEIQDEVWKSGRYYVNDAYPEKREFTLRATLFSENASLCAKLRLSEKRKTKAPTPESCIAIKVELKEAPPEKPQEKTKETPTQKTKEISQKSPSSKEKGTRSLDEAPIQQPLSVPPNQSPSSEEIIPLNPLSTTGKVIITSEEKTRIGMMAAFFIIVIGILGWVLYTEKKKREQENI